MGLQDEIAVLQGAPGTSVAVPVFDKIYWALVLVAPETLVHLTTLHIELHQRAGRDQWVHPPVILTDVAVAKIAGIEAFQESHRHPSPCFDHSREVGGALWVESRIQADR